MLRRDFFKTLPGLATLTMAPILLPKYAHAVRLKITDVRLIKIRLVKISARFREGWPVAAARLCLSPSAGLR